MESDNFRKWVIAAHLVANQNFSDAAIRNEFLLIGIVFAIVFNLFHANAGHEKHIREEYCFCVDKDKLVCTWKPNVTYLPPQSDNIWKFTGILQEIAY